MKCAISGTFYFVVELPDDTDPDKLEEALDFEAEFGGVFDDLILQRSRGFDCTRAPESAQASGTFRLNGDGNLVHWRKP